MEGTADLILDKGKEKLGLVLSFFFASSGWPCSHGDGPGRSQVLYHVRTYCVL